MVVAQNQARTANGMWGLSVTQDPRALIYLGPAGEALYFIPPLE